MTDNYARRVKVLFVVNADWYFLSHRASLAQALRDRGFEVVVAAAEERGLGDAIERAGFRFIPIPLDRRSTAPLKELATFRALLRLYARESPDIIHHITIKPVLYGSIASRLTGMARVVNAIPGLGYTFIGKGRAGRMRRALVTLAYRIAASRSMWFIFQNSSDRELFCSARIVEESHTALIRGSGVDVDTFIPHPEPDGTPIVLLASRLLWDKGVGVFASAARLLQERGARCRMVLVGSPDAQNPNSLDQPTLDAWGRECLLEIWGHRSDMPHVFARAAIVVLPTSYPEGVPKVLLEAAASGRPMVVTDVPGCRDVVTDGVTGFLVPQGDAEQLAGSILRLLEDPDLRRRMGSAARELAERDFTEQKVIEDTIAVYHRLLRLTPISG